jgi:hypothetical protein
MPVGRTNGMKSQIIWKDSWGLMEKSGKSFMQQDKLVRSIWWHSDEDVEGHIEGH